MNDMQRWTVEILVGENDGDTYAEARLRDDVGAQLLGTGRATLHENEPDVPVIGAEIAVARALSDLGHRLLITAAVELQGVLDEPVRLSR